MRRHALTMAGFISLCGAVLFAAGCNGGPDGWSEKPGPRVLAYFPPIYSLAASIAGDDAQVTSLLANKGPHDYDPKASDARRLHRADLFLTIGLGLDDSVSKKLSETCSNPNLKVVELGERLPKELLREGTCDCGHEHEKSDDHDHGFDPHVWLGIPEAIIMVDTIRGELTALDPSHAEGYKKRAESLTARLNALQAEGKTLLETKKEKARLLTYHDSLHYFARAFGIEIVDAIELPGRDPSGKRLNQLVEICKSKNVRLIAVEPQYPANTSAQAILRELKLKGIADPEFVELDPLETADQADLTPDFYERTCDGICKIWPRFSNERGAAALGSRRARRTRRDEDSARRDGRRRSRQDHGADWAQWFRQDDVTQGDSQRSEAVRRPNRFSLRSRSQPSDAGAYRLCAAAAHDRCAAPDYRAGFARPRAAAAADFPGTRQSDLRRMIRALGQVFRNPAPILDRPVEKLSGGELQRVLLALALDPKPELLLLDEPAAGIDFKDQDGFYDLLSKLNADTGVTILLVSHDTSMVDEHAHHVLCLKDGRIQCEGPPKAISPEVLAATFGSEIGVFAHHHQH